MRNRARTATTVVTTTALASLSLLAAPAIADRPEEAGKSHHHSSPAKGHGKDHGNEPGKGKHAGDQRRGNGAGGPTKQDPPGNNGTVKIAPLGDLDTIPNNSPHQSCEFTVQWYGFDGGDYFSEVDFALHAPTTDGTLSGDQPSRVFVGEDAAGGAGQDFDAEQVYRLGFTGTPHPKQGYHVKLTVHTPHSQGSDKKSKVFWVEPCTDSSSSTPTPSESPSQAGSEQPGGTTPTVAPTESILSGQQGVPSSSTTPTVAPSESVGTPGGGSTAGADQVTPASVPTAVDAGDGSGPMGDATNWLLAGLGALIASAGAYLGLSRRRGSSHQA